MDQTDRHFYNADTLLFMIPLFTSIPTGISRLSKDGEEIGGEYALKCIESWRKSGFLPISVNAQRESLSELVNTADVKVIQVSRDASAQYGKPLVYLGDFVSAACSLTRGPVAIANADILIDMSLETRELIENLQPGHCLLSRRLDVMHMDSREGVEFPHGYDFFAFHTEDLSKFSDSEFVIGLPWWDHYFPIQMYFRNVESVPVTTPFVFHLLHEDRWELDRWIKLGNRFVTAMRSEISVGHAHSDLARQYLQQLNEAVVGQEGPDAERARASSMNEDITIEERLNRWMLGRVATLNMRWLEKLRLLSA